MEAVQLVTMQQSNIIHQVIHYGLQDITDREIALMVHLQLQLTIQEMFL